MAMLAPTLQDVPILRDVLDARRTIAYAGRLFGVPVTIVVPEDANPGKVASMRSVGAEVAAYGRDFDEGREHVERLVQVVERLLVDSAEQGVRREREDEDGEP